MKSTNPFPGMNPWLEEHWPGVHALLIANMCQVIGRKLPEDLSARPEEGVSISAEGCDKPHEFRADIVARESWREGVAPAWNARNDELESRAAIPTIVQTPPMTERWIEIREAAGRLITIIEILSPGNKNGDGWHDYITKRRALLESPINLVEIDLLLGGRRVFSESYAKLPRTEAAHYFISTKRAGEGIRREIYRPLLREPLPVIPIPLRKGEKDVFIDLQSLLNQVYEAGRYHLLDYRNLPDLPIPQADQQWLQEKAAG